MIALDAGKEKQRQEVIRKIHKDLHEKLLHFDKDPTIYLRSDYIHCVTSLSVYWKERIDTDEETFTDWFNAALQRTRNTLKKSHEMIPDIVMPKASSEKNCQKKRCPETSETPHVLKRKYVECDTYVDEASHEELLADTPNSQVGQNSAGETDQQCDEVYLSSDSSCSYLGFEDMRMQYCKNLVVKILAKEKLISLQVKTQRRDDIVDKECNPERNDLETSSKFHVDDILSEMKTKCKAKLRKKFTKEQVDELWMDVVKRVYSALDYSATPTDWSFLTRSGHDNPECMLSWKQWDTYNGLIPTSVEVEVDGFAMAMRSEDDEDTARDI